MRRDSRYLVVFAAHAYPPESAYCTREGAFVRGVAHGLKTGQHGAVRHAAAALAPLLPLGATLVPVPSSGGDTAPNRRLAEALARLTGGCVEDGLERAAGESQYARRKRGARSLEAREMRVRWAGGRLRDPVVLVDNVVTTGATARAAAGAIGRSVIVAVWADARRRT